MQITKLKNPIKTIQEHEATFVLLSCSTPDQKILTEYLKNSGLKYFAPDGEITAGNIASLEFNNNKITAISVDYT